MSARSLLPTTSPVARVKSEGRVSIGYLLTPPLSVLSPVRRALRALSGPLSATCICVARGKNVSSARWCWADSSSMAAGNDENKSGYNRHGCAGSSLPRVVHRSPLGSSLRRSRDQVAVRGRHSRNPQAQSRSLVRKDRPGNRARARRPAAWESLKLQRSPRLGDRRVRGGLLSVRVRARSNRPPARPAYPGTRDLTRAIACISPWAHSYHGSEWLKTAMKPGLRCGQMMALEWGDVDPGKRQLCVQRSD